MEQPDIGIDLHQAFFQACAIRGDGTRVWERRFDRTPEGLAAFVACGITTFAMAVEATGPT
jgi:transposase